MVQKTCLRCGYVLNHDLNVLFFIFLFYCGLLWEILTYNIARYYRLCKKEYLLPFHFTFIWIDGSFLTKWSWETSGYKSQNISLCYEFLCDFIFLKCSLDVFCVAPSHTTGASCHLKRFFLSNQFPKPRNSRSQTVGISYWKGRKDEQKYHL